MNEGGFSTHLESIDQRTNAAVEAELEHTKSMERVHNYVEAVAQDEFSLELIEEHPEIETGISADEVSASARESRQALIDQVEAAVTNRKKALRAEHQVELERNKLFSSDRDVKSGGEES